MIRPRKVWFAEKQNGEVIELTEFEALTHFEHNNISQRMRLKFLGTSDGTKYAEGKERVKTLLDTKRNEEIPEYFKMNAEERKIADYELRTKYAKEIKEITDEAYKAELEQAKLNGVQKPDPSLRIITQKDGGQADPMTRNKIINSM